MSELKKDKYYYQKQYAKNNLIKLGIDVKPEIKEKLKICCAKNNITYTKLLKDFINDYISKNENRADT